MAPRGIKRSYADMLGALKVSFLDASAVTEALQLFLTLTLALLNLSDICKITAVTVKRSTTFRYHDG